MSDFTDRELSYLHERRLARIAMVGKDGIPHVVPVGMWTHNPEHDAIEVRGHGEAIQDPEPLIRIHPRRIVSWGIEGDRLGEQRARSVGPQR